MARKNLTELRAERPATLPLTGAEIMFMTQAGQSVAGRAQELASYFTQGVSDFSSLYLGVKTADPLLDNAGLPLVNGAMYFQVNGSVIKWRVRESGAWRDDQKESTAVYHTNAGGVRLALSGLLDAFGANVKLWGAKGDGVTNDTTAINTALAWCLSAGVSLYFPPGTYRVSEAFVGAGYMLLNRGVAMYGSHMLYTVIMPITTAGTQAAVDIMRWDVQGDVADPNDECIYFHDFSIIGNISGTRYGRCGIYVPLAAATASSITKFLMQRVFIDDTRGRSIKFDVNAAIATGAPATSKISDCMFYGGMEFIRCGDSVTVEECTVRTFNGIAGAAIEHTSIAGSDGYSSVFTVQRNNIVADGGAVRCYQGRLVKILDNNIEMHGAAAGSNTAMIDIGGDLGMIHSAEVRGNLISNNTDAGAVGVVGIRVGQANTTRIKDNLFYAKVAGRTAIKVEAASIEAIIGNNTNGSGANLTMVSDAGQRTRGGPAKALTPVNGFTNFGGIWPPIAASVTEEGVVILQGTLNVPAAPGIVAITTLPVGMRPIVSTLFSVFCTNAGGTVLAAGVSVATTGIVTWQGTANATFLDLSGVSFRIATDSAAT